MDEAAAVAGLERTEERLRLTPSSATWSCRRSSTLPGQPLPHEQRGPVRFAAWSVAGRLPGGVPGRLRHQAVYGSTFGMKIAGQHTIMVCRIPESVGYLPMLSVRAEGLEPSLFYWAGDKRPREDVGGFESVELDRRYIVEVAKGQDPAWLRQMFPPSFIDWLASNTPVDFGFRLDGGVFTCECPQYRGQHRADGEVDDEHLDLLGGAGGKAASRIRDEVLEEADVSWGGTAPDSAAAHAARAGGKKHGRLVGMLMKLAGDAGDDSVTRFGEAHGMEPKAAAEFHANHIRLPLPGTASDVLEGPLPGSDRQGELAWMEYSSDVDLHRNFNAAVLAVDADLPASGSTSTTQACRDSAKSSPPAAREARAGGGYGIATAGRDLCVYVAGQPGSTSWPASAEVERLCTTPRQSPTPSAPPKIPPRARSSVGERSLHTREVGGSKPPAPIDQAFSPSALQLRALPAYSGSSEPESLCRCCSQPGRQSAIRSYSYLLHRAFGCARSR